MGIYTIKIYKSFGGRASRGGWVNTYDIDSQNALGSPELDAEIDVIVAMEKKFHLAQVHFMRAVASTIEKEGRKGHPEAVRVRELEGTGAVNPPAGVDVLPLDVCLAVKAAGTTGRSGTMLYRGALTEADVSGSGSGAFNYYPQGTQAMNALTEFMAAPGRPKLVIPMAGSADGTPAREITQLKESGVIIKKKEIRRKKKTKIKDDVQAEGTLNNMIDQAMDFLSLVLGAGKPIPVARKSVLLGKTVQVIDSLTNSKTHLELPSGNI